jgi:hypothetical protein
MSYRVSGVFLWGFFLGAMMVPVSEGHGQGGTKALRDSSGGVQQDTIQSSYGSVLGTVTDSVHGGPLQDASVTVVQMPRKSVITSETGAFKVDSLPPGVYTLEILHPVLDSLGIRVVSDSVRIVGGDVQAVTLGIPSKESLVARICPPIKQQLGPAAIVGQVLDAESGAPMIGAEVSVAWFETRIDPAVGVKTTPRVRKAVVGESGAFRICGVPADLHGTLQASMEGAVTGEVELLTTAEMLVVRFLRLSREQSVVPTDTGAVRGLRTGKGVVTGVVTNRGGVPIGGARVVVNGSTARSVTQDDGSFSLSGVPLGTQVLEVRQMGYLPEMMTIDVIPNGENRVTVRLGTVNTEGVQLSGVEVRAAAAKNALERVGFFKRRNRETGRFYTEAEIDKMQPVVMSDILRRVPGLYVVGSGRSVTVVSSRGNTCVRYLIDRQGFTAESGVSIDEFVNPTDVAAIEFYQASAVPMELRGARVTGCAVVVIWTRAQVRGGASGGQ